MKSLKASAYRGKGLGSNDHLPNSRPTQGQLKLISIRRHRVLQVSDNNLGLQLILSFTPWGESKDADQTANI